VNAKGEKDSEQRKFQAKHYGLNSLNPGLPRHPYELHDQLPSEYKFLSQNIPVVFLLWGDVTHIGTNLQNLIQENQDYKI
jgi:hypothetical protein